MNFFPSAFHQHVVHVNLDISPNLLREHFIHKPFVCRVCILQVKGHHFIVEKALTSYECLLIGFVHSDLVVTRESVHKA